MRNNFLSHFLLIILQLIRKYTRDN
jgi:hypothetical protein